MNNEGSQAVSLHGVRRSFGGRAVLDGIDLLVNRGEFFALVGPSGSGKSTLLKIVSGIDNVDEGRVWLGRRDVTDAPPYRRSVHTVFQNYALFPHLNVERNIDFPLKMAGLPRAERRARVARALGWVNMESYAARPVDRLSGGERQRVALARALVSEPEVVLLDEPLSALDPHLRRQTLELLQDLQARLGTTYLYVTHDREEAMRAAHRVGVLNEGRLEQVGAPEHVYRRPETAFVASFVGPINWLRGVVHVNQGLPRLYLPGAGDIPLEMQEHLPPTRVQLGVRPEDVRIDSDGFIGGEVIGRQFSGATVYLRLLLDGGVPFAAEVRAENHTPGLNERVFVSWDVGRGHLFGDAL